MRAVARPGKVGDLKIEGIRLLVEQETSPETSPRAAPTWAHVGARSARGYRVGCRFDSGLKEAAEHAALALGEDDDGGGFLRVHEPADRCEVEGSDELVEAGVGFREVLLAEARALALTSARAARPPC